MCEESTSLFPCQSGHMGEACLCSSVYSRFHHVGFLLSVQKCSRFCSCPAPQEDRFECASLLLRAVVTLECNCIEL